MARRVLIPTVVLASLYLPVFWNFCVWHLEEGSDYAAHLALIRRDLIGAYPFFHWSVLALSGRQEEYFRPAAALSLTLASAAAVALSAGYLARSKTGVVALTITCLALALAMPLPTGWLLLGESIDLGLRPGMGLYLGKTSPNVWHNPTTIFAMPFAIALYWLSVRALRNLTFETALGLGIAMVLCAMAKPNYVLALAPCLAIALLGHKLALVDKITRLAVAFVPPLVVLFGQAVMVAARNGSTGEELVLAPYETWRIFTPNIPLSVLVGVAFPLAVVLIYRGQFEGEVGLKLAWVVLAMAIFQNAMFTETGARSTHGNWGWGMVFADHILFLASCEFLSRQARNGRRALCYGVLFLHVASGASYLARTILAPPEPLGH